MAATTQILTSAIALDLLAAQSPYKTYHELEVAARALFRTYYLSIPSQYSYRDFLTWAFSHHKIVQTRLGFAVI